MMRSSQRGRQSWIDPITAQLGWDTRRTAWSRHCGSWRVDKQSADLYSDVWDFWDVNQRVYEESSKDTCQYL